MTSRVVAMLALSVLALDVGAARAADCRPLAGACVAATGQVARACSIGCRRLVDRAARRDCRRGCRDARAGAAARCGELADPCLACGSTDVATCLADAHACRSRSRQAHRECSRACRRRATLSDRLACRERCATARGARTGDCGYVMTDPATGPGEVPDLPLGAPADLTVLLDASELAAVTDADVRAATLRSRGLRIVGPPDTAIRVAQVRHDFTFGFAWDARKFDARPADDLTWYLDVARRHTRLAVTENNAKWARTEPEPGVRAYDLPDRDFDLAEAAGFDMKIHTLAWGIVPPFSSSGVPQWALDRFAPPLPLPVGETAALREILRAHVTDLVGRYRGRASIIDVTNETLQPLATWFVDRLGDDIVNDLFHWAHAADPDATLVFNEWIVEVFTGLTPEPTAATVRDRVLELLDAGVPVHALGQQAHFTPGAAFGGVPVDFSQRTRIDDYAVVLDTLAATGLPIQLTETNFIAPDEPELRAAQAEALMRLWWGHPSVEQVVFWGLWNAVAGRDEFDVGIWDDDRQLSRHGEAVVSLMNDRWRTDVALTTDASGVAETTATHGDYVLEWSDGGTVRHAEVVVRSGAPTPVSIVLGP